MKCKWLLLLVLFAPLAFTQPNQDHTCQGGHNCNQGGGGNESSQSQAQSQRSVVNISNDSDATARSGSDSSATSSSSSGGNTLSASGGRSTSSAEASGGNSEATGGSAVAQGGAGGQGQGGTSTATGGSSGDSSASSGGNSQAINFERSAASAASIFAGHCQSGASAQAEVGGFSVINTDQFCDYIRLAAVMREAYEWERRDCICVGICTRALATVEMECTMTDKADRFLDAYYDNLFSAQALLAHSSATAAVDRVAGQVIRPAALLGMLMWIL